MSGNGYECVGYSKETQSEVIQMELKFENRKLKNLRTYKGLSQEELGQCLDRKVRSVQKYESGSVEPSITIINSLAKALMVNPCELLSLSNSEPSINKEVELDINFLSRLISKEFVNVELTEEDYKYILEMVYKIITESVNHLNKNK